MAKRKDTKITEGEAAQAKSELPTVESPPLSQGTETPATSTERPSRRSNRSWRRRPRRGRAWP